MKIGEAVDKEKVIMLAFGDCIVGGKYAEMYIYMARKGQKDLLGHQYLVAGRMRGGTVHHLVDVAEDMIVARSSFRRSVRNNFKPVARTYM